MVVVEAIRALCLKFPAKHRSLMNFLSNILREEGGFEYKKSIVNAILALIQVCWSVVCLFGGVRSICVWGCVCCVCVCSECCVGLPRRAGGLWLACVM